MCLQGVTIQNDPPPTPQTQSHRHRKPKQINNETITTISKRNKVVGKTVLCEKGEEPHHNLCFLRKKKKKTISTSIVLGIFKEGVSFPLTRKPPNSQIYTVGDVC